MVLEDHVLCLRSQFCLTTGAEEEEEKKFIRIQRYYRGTQCAQRYLCVLAVLCVLAFYVCLLCCVE
jgi:hypothetical protein